MARFSWTDFSSRLDKIIEAALKGPVKIAGKRSGDFVLLTAVHYGRLLRASDTRRAFHADTAPRGIADLMITALEREDG